MDRYHLTLPPNTEQLRGTREGGLPAAVQGASGTGPRATCHGGTVEEVPQGGDAGPVAGVDDARGWESLTLRALDGHTDSRAPHLRHHTGVVVPYHGLLGASHAIGPVHACRPLGSFRDRGAWRAHRAAALPHRSFQQRPCYADVFGQHLLLALQCLDASPLLGGRPLRSVGDMLSPAGPWRTRSSSLDVMAHSPLARRIVKGPRKLGIYIFIFPSHGRHI